MDRLIANNTVAVGSGATAPLTGTPGQATDGNPASGIPATNFPAYAFNAIQEEMIAVLLAAGITPDRTSNVQLLAAIKGVATGRLIGIQQFTLTATYIPTPGMSTCIIDVTGGGGGGAGCAAPSTGNAAASGGGGQGGHVIGQYTAAQIGASKPVTIGSGGNAGPAGSHNGFAGGTSSVGSLLSAGGGTGGGTGTPGGSTSFSSSTSGNTGAISGGNIPANWGSVSFPGILYFGQLAFGGLGGASCFGVPGGGAGAGVAGSAGTLGSGGGGCCQGAGGSALAGGRGGDGFVIIWEFA